MAAQFSIVVGYQIQLLLTSLGSLYRTKLCLKSARQLKVLFMNELLTRGSLNYWHYPGILKSFNVKKSDTILRKDIQVSNQFNSCFLFQIQYIHWQIKYISSRCMQISSTSSVSALFLHSQPHWRMKTHVHHVSSGHSVERGNFIVEGPVFSDKQSIEWQH